MTAGSDRPRVAVVGAGISGLVTAHRLAVAGDLEVELFEARDRVGGTIGTLRDGGFVVETGPNGFLDSGEGTVALCRELGIEHRLVRAQPAARNRFVVSNGRLAALPHSPLGIFRTPALSLRGRLRTALEGIVRPGRPPQDESLAAFAARRVGRECAETLVDAMVNGIFAGDPERLEAAAAFPEAVALERQHGSLTRGMIARQRAKKRAGQRASRPQLTSFAEGMQTLVDRLGEVIGDALTTGHRLTSLRPSGATFVLGFRQGDGGPANEREVDAVVLAIPGYAVGEIEGLPSPLVAAASAIPYAPVTVVALGFERRQVAHPLDGFGFLAPHREGLPLLGALWSSSIYPGRAPDGAVLFRCLVGGARDPGRAALDDDQLVDLLCQQLSRLVGVAGRPTFERIVRWPRGIPQYEIGHGARLSAIASALVEYPGLFVTGNAYRGIGLKQCVANATEVAAAVRRYLAMAQHGHNVLAFSPAGE